MQPVDIGGRMIGSDACYVIAEVGVNHNGDPEIAHRLIDVAADAGADAVKFQTFDPELVAAPDASLADYQARAVRDAASQLEMIRALVLPRAIYPQLMTHSRDRGLTFLSTPFDEGSADFLDALGVPMFKVSSGDLTHPLLLRHLARKGKPILLSTGMADLEEVRSALSTIRSVGHAPIVVLHCVSNYPAEPADCHLHAMAAMRDALDVPVGFSDHTLGWWVAVGAVALGAAVIEKHVTLDRALPGPDHGASADPKTLRTMIEGIREVERALGLKRKAPTQGEAGTAEIARRSLYWRRAMRSGDTVREEDLTALRPATGVPTDQWVTIVGRRLTRDVEALEPVSLQQLKP